MSDVVIKAENLGKRYSIRHQGNGSTGYQTFREMLTGGAKSLFRRNGESSNFSVSTKEDFWALRDVSFEVKRGEVLGIIGRNGAGKTTLLKILSRITEPTEGRVRIKGRVASLLEVGTGFHPELTGRENIHLNGAILGMTKAEIKKKFDEIVAFAETEKFLDTPVKRYSSGMYVRLAFAVAAHLEPEILVVDEVLAVGDAEFQKKCLGKMRDVSTREGRTVLFVSHNMAAIQTLCSRALLLDNGKVVATGAVSDVIRSYSSRSSVAEVVPLDVMRRPVPAGETRLTSVLVKDADGRTFITTNSRLRITIGYESKSAIEGLNFLVGIYDVGNSGLYLLRSDTSEEMNQRFPARGTVVCVTQRINLTPGNCYLNLALQRGGSNIDYIQHAAEFQVEPDDSLELKKMPPRSWVLCFLDYEWSRVDSSD